MWRWLQLGAVTLGPGSPHPLVEDFRFGAEVFSADARHIGLLSFMIVDGESFDVRAIVVRESSAFSGHHGAAAALMEDCIAVPLTDVRSVEPERVTLAITATEARRLAPYLTYRYAPLDRGDMARMLAAQLGQTGYAPHLAEEAHKRLGEIEIRRGENVMLGTTGRKLGSVRDIILDGGELVGVVIRPTGFFKEDVLLQVRFLGRSDDMALFAHLSEADLEHLRPFHPGRAG